MTRPIATRDPKPSTFTAGYPRTIDGPLCPSCYRPRRWCATCKTCHCVCAWVECPRKTRPVAPQRHRERTDLWTEPHDGRSWTEEASVWIAGVLTAVGILLAAWALVALALSAGPGR